MRQPPSWTMLPKYPLTGGVILLSLGVTLAGWNGYELGKLRETVAIRQGELWRLVTSTLPHVNALHLIFNLYWIWVFGTLVEEVFGHLRALGIFVLFAVVANGSEYAILDGGTGLSGVGYGLFGMLWVLSSRSEKFSDVIDKSTVSLFVVWFFACIVMTMAGMPIGNIAHGMGAACGALLGYVITSHRARRFLAAGAMTALVAAVLLGATLARPWINLSKLGGLEEGRLGYEALLDQRNEEALRWLKDAVRMQPKDARMWINYGIALDRLNHQDEAQAAFHRAKALDPTTQLDN